MKKAFTLLAAALICICASAQDYGPCPSKCYFALLNADDPAQVEVELQLTNSSLNLNGFNMEILKEEGSEALAFKRVNEEWFTAEGYAGTILARLEGVTDEEREELLNELCSVSSNWKQNVDRLVIVEIMWTLDCRFFPVLEEPTGIGKFWLDFSNCPDGDYTITAPSTSTTMRFAYSGGPEGDRGWTGDAVTITFNKAGDVITVKNEDPQPQPVEYDAFYLTGTFNGWTQDVANMTELTSNEEGTQFTGTVELEDGAEFKVVTPVEGGLKWFGGEDANQVGYFEINDGLLNTPIALIEGANFKVAGEGRYIITVMNPAKGLQEPLVMTVAKEATGVSNLNIDTIIDNRIFDLQGRELQSAPEHGIYIQNGKKYVK